jgi:GntR family transcriptional regulator/MocR family aminotransferase
LSLSINLTGAKRGYLELSTAIIEAAQSGRLPANSLLPPSRILAESLGISRDTVLRCYRHLRSLGWIESRGTSGTFIATAPRTPANASKPPVDTRRLSTYAARFVSDTVAVPEAAAEPVVYSAAPAHFLPIRRWKSAIQRAAVGVSNRQSRYHEAVLGRPELRAALSSFLNRSRGIPCTPEEVVVFSGSFPALSLLCRMFLEPGDVIAMEEPGIGGVREVASYLGLEVLAVPVNSDGFSVEALQNSKKQVKAVYVTANHQEPTGTPMSLPRRRQLLSWAQKNKAVIIEDDLDGNFHYGTQLPPSLKSMDTQDNVIYLASFWQVLYPLTTLSFAVLPLQFVDIAHHAKLRTASLAESSPQLALAEMLDDGYLQKHMRKVERELAPRRRAVIYELKRAFGADVHIPVHTCGLTLIAHFQNLSDSQVQKAAQSAGFPVTSTDLLYRDAANRPLGEWTVYFAGLEEQEARKTITNFARFFQTSNE